MCSVFAKLSKGGATEREQRSTIAHQEISTTKVGFILRLSTTVL